MQQKPYQLVCCIYCPLLALWGWAVRLHLLSIGMTDILVGECYSVWSVFSLLAFNYEHAVDSLNKLFYNKWWIKCL